MIAIVNSLVVSNPHSSGFSLVTLFGLVGMLASLVLVQHGVDISPAAML